MREAPTCLHLYFWRAWERNERATLCSHCEKAYRRKNSFNGAQFTQNLRKEKVHTLNQILRKCEYRATDGCSAARLTWRGRWCRRCTPPRLCTGSGSWSWTCAATPTPGSSRGSGTWSTSLDPSASKLKRNRQVKKLLFSTQAVDGDCGKASFFSGSALRSDGVIMLVPFLTVIIIQSHPWPLCRHFCWRTRSDTKLVSNGNTFGRFVVYLAQNCPSCVPDLLDDRNHRRICPGVLAAGILKLETPWRRDRDQHQLLNTTWRQIKAAVVLVGRKSLFFLSLESRLSRSHDPKLNSTQK